MDQLSHWEKNGIRIRPARAEDADAYFTQNYCPLDREAARLTGCKTEFSKEEVTSFFLRSLDNPDRRFFLILTSDGRIIGETVISDIDRELRCANFRICIFCPEHRGRGVGTWAVEVTRDYAFEALKLHRLELDVFSFNPRAEQAYRRAGFRREGVRRDAVLDGDTYADDIQMAILEEEWRELKR